MSNSDRRANDETIERAGMLENSGDLQEAIDVLSDAVKLEPENARLHAHRGRLFYLREQWQEATSEFDTALSIQAQAPTTLFFRARARTMLGDLKGALQDFQACVELEPASADAIYEIALIYEYEGKLDRALHSLKKAAAMTGGNFRDVAERIEEAVRRGG